jgi:nucleoid DNA-binding protein
MKPRELIADISERASVQPFLVKKVLQGFAASLTHMEEGDSVRTPLGTFRQVRLKGRKINNIGTGDKSEFGDTLIVRFRAASSLRQKTD